MSFQISYNAVYSEAWIFLLCLYANRIDRSHCSTVHPIEPNIESNSTMADIPIVTVLGSGTIKRLLGHRTQSSRMS